MVREQPNTRTPEPPNALSEAVDTLSLDHGASKDFAVHYSVLPANKWGIENLANLAKIPEAGPTIFVGLPRVKGASGGPARILAVW